MLVMNKSAAPTKVLFLRRLLEATNLLHKVRGKLAPREGKRKKKNRKKKRRKIQKTHCSRHH